MKNYKIYKGFDVEDNKFGGIFDIIQIEDEYFITQDAESYRSWLIKIEEKDFERLKKVEK